MLITDMENFTQSYIPKEAMEPKDTNQTIKVIKQLKTMKDSDFGLVLHIDYCCSANLCVYLVQ